MGPLAAMIPLITSAVGAAGTIASTISAFRKPPQAKMPSLMAPSVKDNPGKATQTHFANAASLLNGDSTTRNSLLGG